MRKIITIFAFVLVSLTAMAVEVLDLASLTFSQSSQAPGFGKEVIKNADSYIIKYTFDSIAVAQDLSATGTYYPCINGFVMNRNAGEPNIPQRIERIYIPKASDYSVEILDSDAIEFDLMLSPATPLSRDGLNEDASIAEMPLIDSFIPTKVIEVLEKQTYRRKDFLNIMVRPVQYNSAQKKIKIYTNITVRITFANVESSETIYTKDSATVELEPNFSGIIDTVFPVPVPTQTAAYNIGYLIVYDIQLAQEAKRFAEWKKKMGYNVNMIATKTANSAELKEFIRGACLNDTTTQYLLLVGNAGAIPPLRSPFTGHKTDMYYACFDGDDDFTPDVYYGRIPASDTAEAKAAFDKIIAYESGADKDYFANGFLASAYFEDSRNDNNGADGIEDWDFCYSTELLAKAAISKGFPVTRMYYHEPEHLPEQWNSAYAGLSNTQIPRYLLDGVSMSSTFDHNNVIAAINQGKSIVVHHDHGHVTGWMHPNIESWHLSSLRNTMLPIVFSIDCLVGSFEIKNSFASTMLLQEKGGCASIIAANEVTQNEYNGIFKLGMFKSLWPDADLAMQNPKTGLWAGVEVEQAVTLGEMMNRGAIEREKHKSNMHYFELRDKESYHIIGDPSLHVFWNNDLFLDEDISITRCNNELSVNFGGAKSGTVSFSSNRRQFFKDGNNITVSKSNYFIGEPEYMDSIYITIHYDGAKPYCFYMSEIPHTPNPVFPPITIKSYGFNDGKISVDLAGTLTDNTKLEVIPGTLTQLSTPISKAVESLSESIDVPLSNGNIYYIRLLRNSQLIDSKIIIKQ